MHVERAAISEQSAIGRRHRLQHEPVGSGFADGGERLVDDVGHGEHRRTGVEAIPIDIEPADPTTGNPATLHDGDWTSPPGQMQRRRQPGQPGTHHHHVVGVASYGAHQRFSDQGLMRHARRRRQPCRPAPPLPDRSTAHRR